MAKIMGKRPSQPGHGGHLVTREPDGKTQTVLRLNRLKLQNLQEGLAEKRDKKENSEDNGRLPASFCA